MKPVLTHIALGVKDLDRTIAFYGKHVGLHVVHERSEGAHRVVWLGERERDVDFVLVLFQVAGSRPPGPTTLQHLGFAVGSREEVDAAAAAARADGLLDEEPRYAGPVVGYYCIVKDPDGNSVEFSFGQPISPRELSDASKHAPA
ncbi:MAG TPA: VOC family protein [Candidatus Binatia bacterium]|nr:VOC family protein [Candidatus Binatia bacterium]